VAIRRNSKIEISPPPRLPPLLSHKSSPSRRDREKSAIVRARLTSNARLVLVSGRDLSLRKRKIGKRLERIPLPPFPRDAAFPSRQRIVIQAKGHPPHRRFARSCRALQVSFLARGIARVPSSERAAAFVKKLHRDLTGVSGRDSREPIRSKPPTRVLGVATRRRARAKRARSAAAERRSKKRRGLASIVCTVLTLFSHPWYSFQGQEKHFDRL